MEKITDKKQIRNMTFLFMILYLISYLTRINYAAVISEIVIAEGIQKSVASLALTASAITYGIGQLLSGYMGDRIEPKKLIFGGLLTTLTTNLLITLCSSPYQMAVVWGINGIAQAFMWPPLLKIMTSLFTEGVFKKVCVVVSWGSATGTILVYLLSPLCIYIADWRAIFILSAAAAAVMAFVWSKKCPRVKIEVTENPTENLQSAAFSAKPFLLLLPIMLAIVLHGVLRDGVMTWMPSYVSDTFNLSNRIAIMTSVIQPLVSIFESQIVSFVYQKYIKNEAMLCSVLFAISCVVSTVLFIFGTSSVILSVVLAALLSGSIHGVNLIATCMIPPYYKKYGHISLVAGALNFCTYIGSSVSASGLALFSENYGWQNTILLWSVLAGIGCLICGLLYRSWKAFVRQA